VPVDELSLFLLQPLIGLRREDNLEASVVFDRDLPLSDGLIALEGRRNPSPMPPPPRDLGLPPDAPDDRAMGHGQTEVVARGADEPNRSIQARRAFGIFPSHFEGRTLVFLDRNVRGAVGGAVDSPVAEHTAGRDPKLSRGGPVGVGRNGLLIDPLI